MEVIFQGSLWHVLVDKQALIPFGTVTNQIDKIRVMQKWKHEELHKELLFSLETSLVKFLNSYNLLTTIMHAITNGYMGKILSSKEEI